MKKIDLHTHTVASISDGHFDFSLDKLLDYVRSMAIDCIAITNHNIFDLGQFQTITSSLGIKVLPGIEINLEGGHLLLISDNSELQDFSDRCAKISSLIVNKEDAIGVEDLKDIFSDLSNYLLIPHYDKKPIIRSEIIAQLRDYISAGEVASIRKFKACIKEVDKLVPVIFSDTRFDRNLDSFSVRQTYLDLDEITFNGIKTCLFDKNKVSLSMDEGNEIFQVTEDGLKLSTGLNVILGERSSGKTYTLDRISSAFENIKYIRQFSLLQNDEEKFEEKHKIREGAFSENFLREFKNVVEDVVKIDLRQNEIDIEKYLISLVKYASENEKADTYSKASLFAESTFELERQESLKKLIEATVQLIENTEYREIIDTHISLDSLRNLAVDLMNRYVVTEEANLKKKWLNELLKDIQTELRFRTNATYPEEIDFYKVIFERKKVERFTMIANYLKTDREIDRKQIRNFKIVARTRKFTGASQMKAKSRRMLAFTDAFNNYLHPYNFLQALKSIELEGTEYHKYFVEIDYKTLNKYGYPVSGGERSEFKLLHEISDALKYDLLLIDEPESSFDNLFLKNEVNELIKEISKEIPVIVVTHNNTVGASILPDYVLYTSKSISDQTVTYKVYAGYPSSKELKCVDGQSILNYDIILNCLEAGEEAYADRRIRNYEILKG